jgi:hypothetical protein
MPDALPDGGKKTEPTNEDGTINIPIGSVPTELLEAKHPNQTALHTLKRGDETIQVTTEELVKRAQKNWNADVTTQQAAEMRKEAAAALAIQEDLEAAKEGDADAFRRIGLTMGLPADVVEAITQKTFADDEDENILDSYLNESTNSGRRAGPVDISQLSPDIQRALYIVEKQRMNEIVNSALDKDTDIAYNMKEQSPAGQAAIRKFVADKIQGRLNNQYGGDFGDGTRILSEILPEVREHLKALGTPGQRTHTGLGSSPSASAGGVYPTKMPDHIPSTAGEDFDQHILDLLRYHQGQDN